MIVLVCIDENWIEWFEGVESASVDGKWLTMVMGVDRGVIKKKTIDVDGAKIRVYSNNGAMLTT